MSLRVKLGILAAGLMLSGCMQAATYEAANTANFKPHDKELLAKIRYTNTPVAAPFRRAIVEYQRKEAPGSILVDSESHYLYYVLNNGKAIRYGITVGEEAMAWSGIAKIGAMTEWPPLASNQERDRAAWRADLRRTRPGQSDGLARDVSVCERQGHAVSHSRHQSA